MLTKFFKKTFLFTMYVVCPQSFVNKRLLKKKKIPCISKSSSLLKLLEISVKKYREKIMVFCFELTTDQHKGNTHSFKCGHL